jgi:hypothetical protein
MRPLKKRWRILSAGGLGLIKAISAVSYVEYED